MQPPETSDDIFLRLFDDAEAPSQGPRLAASRCIDCGRVEFPRLEHCPSCLAPAEDVSLGPYATVSGYTQVLHPPPGGEVAVPYTVVAAAFPEGIAVLGTMLGDNTCTLGQRIEVATRAVPSGTAYAFRPAVDAT
jgi:uncharacterized OB-fold protein